MNEQELWSQATHVHCLNCGEHTELDYIDVTLDSEDDLDEAYDAVECCDNPALEAEIHSDKPLFANDEANDDARIRSNPVLGIYADKYQYHVGEDLMEQLKGV